MKKKKKRKGQEVAWTELSHIRVQEGFNLRGEVKPDPDLVEKIKKDGVLHPIHIRNSPEGTHYLLVDGERRYQAAKAAGLEGIPVILHEPMSDEEAALFSYRANEAQKPWTTGQKFKMFTKLLDLGWKLPAVQKALLVSDKTLAEYEKTRNKGTKVTKKALSEGEISSRVSSKVADLPKNRQAEAVEKLKGKGTRKSIAAIKNGEKKKNGREESPGPKPESYLADDVESRCRELSRLIHEQLSMSPQHKVLKGQKDVIEVLRGKKRPEDIFPSYVTEMSAYGR